MKHMIRTLVSIQSIQAKMIAYILLLVIGTAAVITGPALYFFTQFVYDEAQSSTRQGMEGLYTLVEEYRSQALTKALLLVHTKGLAEGIAARDTAAVLAVLTPAIKDAGLDFVTVTDEQGVVIARTHEPAKKGDRVNGQANVAKALTGTPLAVIESGTVVKLSARAGVPVKDSQGKIVGVLSTGYDLGKEAIVDRAKAMFGTDVTLFLGDTRLMTTVMKDGKRIVGTKLNEQIADKVLKQGQTYINKAEILNMPYLTAYMPLAGTDGQPIGVVFAGKNISDVLQVRNQIVKVVLIIAAVVLLGAVGFTVFFAQRFTRPLRHLEVAASRMAQGDLTGTVPVASQDEIGRLAGSFSLMMQELKGLLSQTGRLSNAVSASSQELNLGMEKLTTSAEQVFLAVEEVNSGAEQQTAAITHTTEAIEELSASIEQIAHNANAVSEFSSGATEVARAGRSKVETAVQQMETIDRTVQHLAAVVEKLGDRSQEIGKIVDTISSIAGQTNLLALNAAIEAAHAGEHGRGFAVVAEEVRKLAEQSSEAAEQVGKLIQEIRQDTSVALTAMKKGTQDVKVGTEVVDTAGTAFVQIVERIDQISQQIHQISVVASEMSTNSRDMVNSIRDIDKFSQQTTAQIHGVASSNEDQLQSISDMALASNTLVNAAQELQHSMDKFKI